MSLVDLYASINLQKPRLDRMAGCHDGSMMGRSPGTDHLLNLLFIIISKVVALALSSRLFGQ